MSTEKLKVLAFIPARAGSVGVPGKNTRLLLGKPVISYTIEAAKNAKLVDKIVVSSDCHKVRQICHTLNDIIFIDRPVYLSDNAARIDDAMRHSLEYLINEYNYRPDIVVLLYANIPVRNNTIIDRAIEKLIEAKADSVQSLTDTGKFHPFWLYQLDEQGNATKYIPNNIFRRQELPPLYAIDGAVAVVKTEILQAAKGSSDPHAFFGKNRKAVIQQPQETVDIDTPLDFYLAEAILRERQANESM